MITQVDIRDFRVFKNTSIPFKPLTLLTGKNGTGKTTILTILDCHSTLMGYYGLSGSFFFHFFDDWSEYDNTGIKVYTQKKAISWSNPSQIRHATEIDIKPIMFDFTHWSPQYSDGYSKETNEFLGFNSPVFVTLSLFGAFNAVEALLKARKGDIILLENPENGLHPSLQTRMGKLIGETVLRGVQVIVETHSDYLIDGIRILICQGKLNPDDVQVNYLTSEGIKTTTLLVSGEIKDCPDGFLDQGAINLGELLGLDKQGDKS